MAVSINVAAAEAEHRAWLTAKAEGKLGYIDAGAIGFAAKAFAAARDGVSYIRYEQMPPEYGRFGCDGRYRIDVEAASPADRVARKSGKVTLTVDASYMLAAVEGGWGRDGFNHDFIRDNDRPGIAAMAAKNVQPTPEPVLSVGGEQVTEREIAQALALLRGQNAPAVKETPRGLLTVAAMDHRLGRWNEA
jgi:hypothetical protein